MRITINNRECVLPSSLSEMTLGERIRFQREHGDLLLEMHKSIEAMEDEVEKELELTQLAIEQAFRTVSFFTGFSAEDLKQSEFFDLIVAAYHASMGQLLEEEQLEEAQIRNEFIWNDETWEIHVPELKHGDRMTFGEFIDSKQVMQDMINLGKSKWECLIPLCAIYLRRKGEAYQESFLYPDSERQRLMENLPLDIALQVGFFLSSCLDMYTRISPSSSPQELKAQVVSLVSTLNNSDGLTFSKALRQQRSSISQDLK